MPTSAPAPSRALQRLVLFGATLVLVVPLLRGLSSGAIPPGPVRVVVVGSFLGAAVTGLLAFRRHLAHGAATRRTTELLRLFDDLSLLRPRAQAARALLAGAPANEVERKALVAVSLCLGELAQSVADGTPEGRRAVLAHPFVGAWLRAIAVTPIPVAFADSQRSSLQALCRDVGAARSRRDPLDEGSRALLERDAVMFRADEADVRIF
jgi:hypothetical protein